MRGQFGGSFYSLVMSPHGEGLIGGPKQPPVLSLLLTKALGCGCMEDRGCREATMGMSRFPI